VQYSSIYVLTQKYIDVLAEYLKPYGAKDRKMKEKKAEEQAELKRLREAANEGNDLINTCKNVFGMSVYSCHLKTINFLYFREKHL
jgi:chromosome condensin MukBEF complex kleisin-like MukF subunit